MTDEALILLIAEAMYLSAMIERYKAEKKDPAMIADFTTINYAVRAMWRGEARDFLRLKRMEKSP